VVSSGADQNCSKKLQWKDHMSLLGPRKEVPWILGVTSQNFALKFSVDCQSLAKVITCSSLLPFL
jgi:hypothetical protein